MLEGSRVVLRDFRQSDIQKRILWETVETEWQLWDAPWEYEDLSATEREAALEGYTAAMRAWVEKYKSMPDAAPRAGFQIDCKATGEYIGWCNSYYLDDDFCYTDEKTSRTAIGIDVPAMSARGKGCAFEALTLFINYLIALGENDIYTQTWSGNARMIALAQKLGFCECRRKRDIRRVRGKTYDGLTFKLDITNYTKEK